MVISITDKVAIIDREIPIDKLETQADARYRTRVNENIRKVYKGR